MGLVRCDNGHFYDKEKYGSCPHCSGEYKKSKEYSGNLLDLDTKYEGESLVGNTLDLTEYTTEDMFGIQGWDEEIPFMVDCSPDFGGRELPSYSKRAEDKILSAKFSEVHFFYDRGCVVQRVEFVSEREKQTILVNNIVELDQDILEYDPNIRVRISEGTKCMSQFIVMLEEREQHVKEEYKQNIRQRVKEEKRLLLNLEEQKRLLNNNTACNTENQVTQAEYERKKEFLNDLIESEFEIRSKIKELNKKIDAIIKRVMTKKRALKLDLETMVGQNVIVEILYETDRLRWKPNYELNVATGSNQAAIALSAYVYNETQRDLEDVRATFSTGIYNPTCGSAFNTFGSLDPIVIKKKKNEMWPTAAGSFDASSTVLMETTEDTLTEGMEPVFTNPKIQVPEINFHDIDVTPVIEEKKAFCQDFVLKDLCTFEMYDDNKKICLMTKTYPIEKFYLAIPKKDESVYFSIRILEMEITDLIECDADIYLDDNFIRSFEVNPQNMTEQIAIGRVNGIKVHKEVIANHEKSRILRDSRLQKKEEVLIVENRSDQVFVLKVMDQIPITYEQGVTIIIDDLSNGELDQMTGVCTWNISVAPKSRAELYMKYNIQYPLKGNYNMM